MSKYTLHFKYQAVLHYLHIRSQQRTADHYGISRTHLRRWIRAYQEGGIGALEHPQSKTMTEHRKNPFIADKPDQEKTQAELIEELCYMRAKVAYLKELKALSQKRTWAACAWRLILIDLLPFAHRCRADSGSVDLLPIQ